MISENAHFKDSPKMRSEDTILLAVQSIQEISIKNSYLYNHALTFFGKVFNNKATNIIYLKI